MAFTGTVEDRLGVRELIEAYADAVNRCDAGDWAALWAEDGVWNLPDYLEVGTVRGRNEIVRVWSGIMIHFPGVVFVATVGAIEVVGQSAAARSYTSEVYEAGGATHRDRGVYNDTLIKRDGAWLFQVRTFHSLHRA